MIYYRYLILGAYSGILHHETLYYDHSDRTDLRSWKTVQPGWRFAGGDDRVLPVCLHDVAEAEDAAEHRHRRCGRRVSTDDRLGCRYRWGLGREHFAVSHHFLLLYSIIHQKVL